MSKSNTFQPIYIDYPYQYSSISLPNNFLIFNSSGWLIKPNGVRIYEYWSKEGFANLLPQDYDPDEDELNQMPNTASLPRKDSINISSLKPKAVKIDTATAKAIDANTIAFNQNSLLKVRKSISSYNPDFTIKLKESDYNLTILDILQLRLPGFRVEHDPEANKLRFGFSEYFSMPAALIANPDDLNPTDISPALVLNGIPYYGDELVLQMLLGIDVHSIEKIEASRNSVSALGIREGHGTIIINTQK